MRVCLTGTGVRHIDCPQTSSGASLRYFDTMLQPHWTEHDMTELVVDHSDYDTFYAFLHYLNTGELAPNIENA